MNFAQSTVFDIETDGFLDELTKIHLLTIKNRESDEVLVFRNNEEENTIPEGVEYLMAAAEKGRLIVGHNIIKFDIPAIQKLFPRFSLPDDQVFDTLVMARLKVPDPYEMDVKLIKKGILENHLPSPHSLESWGKRLGVLKDEYEGDTRIEDEKERKRLKWACWNPDMEEYGKQDVIVTEALLVALKPEAYSLEAIRLEHGVARIIARQERFGVRFNEAKAVELYAELADRRNRIARELIEEIPPMVWRDGKDRIPKRDHSGHGYVKGAAFCPIRIEEFNPTSRRHIARVLMTKYGWEPRQFTPTGDPQIDDEVLASLPYPEAEKISELFLLEKRIGQLAEGSQAWMKVSKNGVIHGGVNTNGAVTGRMTHSRPNLAQVPKVGTKYGKECRELFGPPPGMVQVGCDASGLELRCLGHYVARYDDGAYAHAVIHGSQEDGTDVHSLNTKALGLEPQKLYTIGGRQQKGRDCGKTFIYAWLYGAGDEKIGSIVGKGRAEGRKLRLKFLRQSPALSKLKDAVAAMYKKRNKVLRGLDGRLLQCRSSHSALNTLLQSAGAVVMKRALVILDADLQAMGLVPGVDYEFMLNIHDEFQLATKPEIADDVGRTAVAAIRKAGQSFGFRCALDGEYKVGTNWAETH